MTKLSPFFQPKRSTRRTDRPAVSIEMPRLVPSFEPQINFYVFVIVDDNAVLSSHTANEVQFAAFRHVALPY
jgi:hypothetical protein